jgi:regulator of cell morphogenesis and NO signaling
MLEPDTPIANIVLEHSGAATVFDRCHIDYCCDGHVPLDKACANRGVDLAAVIAQLEEATALPDPEADLRTASTSAIISRVLARQHRVLRAALALLSYQTADLARTKGNAHPVLRVVANVTAEIADRLCAHLDHEEDTLFPALLAGTPSPQLRRQLGGMFDEHREFSELLHRLRHVSHSYRPPDAHDADMVAVMHGLEELEHLVLRHHHVENHVLAARFR